MAINAKYVDCKLVFQQSNYLDMIFENKQKQKIKVLGREAEVTVLS